MGTKRNDRNDRGSKTCGQSQQIAYGAARSATGALTKRKIRRHSGQKRYERKRKARRHVANETRDVTVHDAHSSIDYAFNAK